MRKATQLLLYVFYFWGIASTLLCAAAELCIRLGIGAK